MTPSGPGLLDLFWLFLRLGCTAFGGPAAHVALMHTELVARRSWLSELEFLDLVSAANLIPGPTSTEVALHVGYRHGGWRGLLLTGFGFIAPAVLITGTLAGVYQRWGALPALENVLRGVKPVVVVIILAALIGLLPKAARDLRLRLLFAAALGAAALGLHELWVLAIAGAAGWALGRFRPMAPGGAASLLPLGWVVVATTPGAPQVTSVFGVFFKIGGLLYGSGYVLLAFLRAELVERLGWIDETVLLDAVAVGQATPGPLFSTATFLGWYLGGPSLAAAATLGIFLPSFLWVIVSRPFLERLRASAPAGAFLDGVNVASLALMAVVTAQLGRAVLGDPKAWLVAVVAAVLIWRKVSSSWILLGAAIWGGLATSW